ncbi:DUF507 family protein [bacterium]|nr:DUF507 family protein [candidate division CSSED10-310 bacterium]
MKLQPARIELLSRAILSILESENFIEIEDPDRALTRVRSVITEDLMVEVQLDDEVRDLLEKYADKIDQDRIQYHEMFKMVKEKLAKERNLIL